MANHEEADFGEPEEKKEGDSKESSATGSMGPKWTRRSLLTSMGLTGAALLVGSALGRTEARASETSPSPSPSASTPSTTAAETAGSVPQADYVELLRDHNETPATLYAKITGDRKLEVLIPFKGNRCAHYALSKDPNDDFIKLMSGSVSVLEESYNLIGAADYASKTGTWVTNFPPNEYTTEIGASFTFTFEGTGFDFQHYTDNRGGVWEFTVDGQAPLRISTHVDAVPAGQAASNVATRPVVRGLTLASHTVVAVFQGDDPAHPPSGGAGTSRGWVRCAANYSNKSNSYRTALLYGNQPTLAARKLFDVLHSWSNKEFALNVAPTGSGLSANWLPEHVGIGTVYSVVQKILFDDTPITAWTPDSTFRAVQSVSVYQQMLGKHPGDPSNPVAEIDCVHSITSHGASVKAKIRWLRAVTVSQGYGMMFPVAGPFASKMITGMGGVYDATATDNSSTNLTENDQALSYAYVHSGSGSSSEADTVVAMTMQDIAKTLRYGQSGRRSNGSIVWLQHRDATVQKLYPQVYENYSAAAGESYEVGGTYYIGELPMASRLLT